MITFQEDEITIAMAWRHETLTMQKLIIPTPKSHLYVLPTLCSEHKVLEKKKKLLLFLYSKGM